MSRPSFRLAPALITLAALAGGVAAAGPLSPEVSALVVVAPPKDAPPAVTTVLVGADTESGTGQAVSVWPRGALAAGSNGWVTLNCRVDVHGLAETCRVIYESPRGKGFGDAALALRPTLKLPPKTGPDGPEMASMNIAIAFRAPQTESNYDQVQRAAIAGLQPDSTTVNYGHHEIDGRNLIVYHNPLATRSVTLLTSPNWAQAPTFDQLAAAYPAQGGGQEGYVVVHCRVQPTGALKGCAAVRELPIGHGFSTAALALIPHFQASPEMMAGAPKGAPIEVDVPIRFPTPAESKDRVVRAPLWIAGHDPQTLMQAFPVAVRPNSPGAVVKCQVGFDGALTGCGIELTSPDGIDYDEAAVKLASNLKMNLWSAEAGPVLGGVVHIPVRADLASAEQAQR